MLTFEAHKMRY